MKKLLLVLLLILVPAGYGYWYWTTTPQYSLRQLSQSVQEHDELAFRNYFDVDRVSSQAVEDLLSEGVRSVGGAGLLQRLVGMTLARLFKPELSQSLSRKIVDYVQTKPESQPAGTEPPVKDGAEIELTQTRGSVGKVVASFVDKLVEAIKPPSLREVLLDMGLTKNNYRGLTDFETSGNLCRVGLIFHPPGKNEIVVQLELEKSGDHWQVVRFSNLDKVAAVVSGI